jgi:hypothetical protein
MIKFFTFIFLLLLENLILPAFIGPRQFFVTPIFIFGLLVYGNGWRTLLYQILPLILIAEFFTGENFGHLIIPLGLTGAIYLVINKFLNFGQNLRHERKFLSNFIPSVLILVTFNCIYAGLFIFLNTSYQLTNSWYEFTIFFKNSLFSLVGWSALISLLFKYVLKTK